MNNIRVLVVSSDKDATAAIATFLADSGEFELIGVEERGWFGVTRAVKLPPSIIVVDANFWDMNNLQVIEAIKSYGVTPRFVALMRGTDPEYLLALLKAGVSQLAYKPLHKDEFIRALRSVLISRTHD